MASRFRQKDPPLKSWDCKGCTNICYRLIDGQVFKYCRPMIEGRHRTAWISDTFVDCLNKTLDPKATDTVVRLHPSLVRK